MNFDWASQTQPGVQKVYYAIATNDFGPGGKDARYRRLTLLEQHTTGWDWRAPVCAAVGSSQPRHAPYTLRMNPWRTILLAKDAYPWDGGTGYAVSGLPLPASRL
jgi:hypothetical protein